MGIFTFLKQLFQNNAPQEPVINTKKIKRSQLKEWITEFERNTNLLEEEIKEQLSKKLGELSTQLEQKNQILKTIDISSQKVEEKIKLIVKENLPYYILHVDQLITSIDAILNQRESTNLEDFINSITISFNDFEKRSFKNYQKATILIGKEMGDSKEIITYFVNSFQKKIKEQEALFLKKKNFDQIKKEVQEYQELKKNEQHMKESIIKSSEKEDFLKKEKDEKEQELSSYKKSFPYLNFISSQEEKKKKLQEIDKEISMIKQALNIKFLKKFFHTDKKKARLIQEYEILDTALENDSGLNIVKIAQEALEKGGPQELSLITREKLESIRNQKKTLIIQQDPRIDFYEEAIKKRELEILSVRSELEKETRKLEKIRERQISLINSLKNKLGFFSIILEEET